MHYVGNILLGLASLLYLLPLQHLILEYARKKDDGGGAIAGILILAPLWLLLLGGLLLATAQGGFDWLHVRRSALYGLVVAATLALGVATFVSLVGLERASWMKRLLVGWPVYLAPVLTIALVACVLNPALGSRLPPSLYRVPWLAMASLSLLVCTGFLGYKSVVGLGHQLAGLGHRLSGARDLAQQNLARIPTLDPRRDFEDLLGLSSSFNSREVRELAVTRLRSDPEFLNTLVASLEHDSPDKPLALLESAEFSAEERRLLAAAAGGAMLRYADGARAELKYAPPSRRKLAHRWGTHLLREVGRKFSDAGLDAAPALAAFDRAFQPEAELEEAR